MAAFIVDRRDLDFVLYEQFKLEELTTWPRYAEMSRETFDMVLGEAVRFATEVLGPASGVADRAGVKIVDGEVVTAEVFKDIYRQYAEGGWIAAPHDPEFGGMGLPNALAIVVTELFIGACASFMFFPGLTAGAGHLIEAFGSDALKERFVARMYSGEWSGTMCLTEPQAGTSVGDLTTTATPIEGTDRFSIAGNKIFISAGDHDLTDNIIHLVLARVPGDTPGTKGISLFAVPKHRVNADGSRGEWNDVTLTALEHKMGIHASPTAALAFGENGRCEGFLVGERQQGLSYMFQMMNEARLHTGSQGVGIANAAYQLALAYAKERVQSTKATDRSDDVRRNLMLAKAYSEGIRALLVQAAVHADRARFHPDPDARSMSQGLLDLLTPVCKAYSTDTGFEVTELAMQIHGGYGYIGEYGVEQLMRDVKIASIYEGTNGVQALDLLGRKLRMKGGALFMAWFQEANAILERGAKTEGLGDIVDAVTKAKDTLGKTAFGFAEKGDPEVALLGATPFLEMFGQVQVGLLLLDQALIAEGQLRAIVAEKGVKDQAGVKKLVHDHEDARFYDAKIKTARFFANAVLPHVRATAAEIAAKDRSALDVIF